MEDNQSDRVEAEATSPNSNDCADVTYTFVFQNDELLQLRCCDAIPTACLVG